MPDHLAAVGFGPDQERLPIQLQDAAPRFPGHALAIAKKFQILAVITAHQVMRRGGRDWRYRKADLRQAPVSSDFKAQGRARHFRQVGAEEIEMHEIRATALAEERRVPR